MPQQPPNPDRGALPGALRGSSHRFPSIFWLVALVWSAIAASPLYGGMRPARGIEPWFAWAALGVFALPGLFFLWLGLSGTLRFARYRALRLELSALPAFFVGSMVLLAAYFLHPEWFSFKDSVQVAAQSVPATGGGCAPMLESGEPQRAPPPTSSARA